MSNFDYDIPPDMEKVLRAGDCHGTHAAWNFYGYVWFQDGLFHEDVWRFGRSIAVRSSDSLQGLMTIVNEEFGSD